MSENNKSDFLDDCFEFFGSKNLYEILGVEKDAKANEIKSAYRKKSLKVHPDRATEDRKEHAKRAFQTLTKIHCVLTDENIRKVYDETGRVITGDDSDFASFSSYEEYEKYWRALFPKISTKQIDEYLEKYIGSDDEKADLKKSYERFKGDMDMIYEYHYAYDEDRVVELLNQLIEAKEVPEYDAFVNESKAKKQKRLKRIEKEERDAKKEEKRKAKKAKKQKRAPTEDDEDDIGDISALQMAIQKKNQGNFNNLLSSLEAKYGNNTKGGKSSKNKRARNK